MVRHPRASFLPLCRVLLQQGIQERSKGHLLPLLAARASNKGKHLFRGCGNNIAMQRQQQQREGRIFTNDNPLSRPSILWANWSKRIEEMREKSALFAFTPCVLRFNVPYAKLHLVRNIISSILSFAMLTLDLFWSVVLTKYNYWTATQKILKKYFLVQTEEFCVGFFLISCIHWPGLNPQL